MNFLCDFHRQQLRYHPHTASRRWIEWLEDGADHFRASDWPRALRLFGSAFETGQLLLEAQPETFAEGDLTGFDRTMIAGHYLAECYSRLRMTAAERQILMTVHHILLAAVDDQRVARHIRARLRFNLAISLQLLGRHYRDQPTPGNPAGFVRLYHQTLARLQFCTGLAH